MRWFYPVVLWLALPLVWLRLQLRARRDPGYGERQSERFGRVEVPPGPIWFHTVSAGETIAAVPLIERLVLANRGYPFLVTNMTPTGSQQVIQRLGHLIDAQRVSHCYAPYDFNFAVRRFFDTVQPRLLVLMETELWPNLVGEAARRGVPVLLVNARLSERSARGYRRGGVWIREMLDRLTHIACQTEQHRQRFIDLGVAQERISTLGSVKFDLSPPPDVATRRATLIRQFGFAGQRVWIAASTHPGEDGMVLDAYARLRAAGNQLRLLLVPRHPNRADEVCGLVRNAGFEPALQSASDNLPEDPAVVVVGDVMGVLVELYSLADVAFVGGSLVAVGGHNPIEPALFDVPVISGPHRFNFEEVFSQMDQCGGVVDAEDEAELAAAVQRLLDDDTYRATVARAARGVVESNRGSTERVQALLQAQIDQLP